MAGYKEHYKAIKSLKISRIDQEGKLQDESTKRKGFSLKICLVFIRYEAELFDLPERSKHAKLDDLKHIL